MKINLDTTVDKTVQATHVSVIRVMYLEKRGEMVVVLALKDADGNVKDRKRIVLTSTQADALIGNSISTDNLFDRIYSYIQNHYPGVITP